MSNKVFEEAPQTPQPSGGAVDKVRKAARQLAYDTRYKVKGKFKDGQKADPASLKRAYMQQLGTSSAPGPVKMLAKKMLIGEEYDFVDVDVESSLSNICAKVFVEGGGKIEEEIEVIEESDDTKYTIRVKDKKTGREYLRKADRAKISELRANPNISSVEITGRREEDTYDKTGGKKAKKDYDGDGKIESGTAEYMGSRDKAIKKSMAKEETYVKGSAPVRASYGGKPESFDKEKYVTKSAKKRMAKEEVIYEKEENDDKKIDIMKGKNTVKVNPSLGESIRAELDLLKAQRIAEQDASMKQQEDEKKKEQLAAQQGKKDKMMKMRILQNKMRAVRGGAEIAASHELEGDTIAEGDGCAHTHEGQECSVHGKVECPSESKKEDAKEVENEDPRSMPAKINLAKNKLRAMGLKMSYDMEGDVVNEEGADSLKDRRMERGGVDGNNRYNKPVSNTPNTFGKKKPKYDGMSAVEKVKASIEKRYGKGAIIDTKKK